MKATLIKTDGGYALKEIVAFVSEQRHEHPHQKLSLKNCQAIERGYDLDELAKREYLDGYDTTELCRAAFKDGFQKALELLGDKKFTEEDIRTAMNRVWERYNDEEDVDCISIKDLKNKHIQSLQQTEWDVTFNPEEKDAEGRLILKRK